jgi:soluble lytic murein transglycosylase-like protein
MARPRHGSLILFGMAVALAIATPADAEMRRASDAGSCRPCVRKGVGQQQDDAYAREIAEASSRYAVPEGLIRAVIRVESGFDRRAVSPRGAQGLMQLMPETAAILGVRDPFDARQNIHGGTRHLRALMERFRHDVRLAVAAYNAGEKPVAQHRGVPPYPETREYVSQVMRYYQASGEPMASARGEMRAGDVRRIVESNGTVLYTNIAYGGPAVGALGR